jgi:Predicted membrane protein (DUF2142)
MPGSGSGSNDLPRDGHGSPTEPPVTTSPRRNLGVFLAAFVAVGLAIVAWSIATPLMAAPDEPYQVVQAAALVRGQIDRPNHRIAPGLVSTVTVPFWVQSATVLANCIAFKPTVPASCQPEVSRKTIPIRSLTAFSHSPPLYYTIAGLPSLFLVGAPGIYAMRFAGVVVNGALVALGLFLLIRYHPRRSTLVGALVALAPMVLFLTSVVNPSGLETAAGFAVWCAGLCIVEQRLVPRSLAIWAALALVIFILARPLSPLYAAIIVVVLGFFAGWRRSRDLLRDACLRAVAWAGAVAAVVAGASLAVLGSPPLLGYPEQPRLRLLAEVHLTLRLTGGRLLQTIGDFGWLDTPAPRVTRVIWLVAAGGLVVVALATSTRCRRAVPLLALAIVALPVVFEAPRLNTTGIYWQGRYWLPLIVGVPLLASTALGAVKSRRGRKPSLALVGVLVAGVGLGVAQLAAFLSALHRYRSGLGAGPHPGPRWSPPGGPVLVVVAFLAGEALLISLVVWATIGGPRWRLGRPRGYAGT